MRDAHSAATRAVREHYSRVLAALAAQFRDVAAAEDALSESLLAALQQWPASGVPDNPAAWLLTVARRRLIDHRRRQSLHATREHVAGDFDAFPDEPEMEDKRLHLLFACAHPAIEEKVRAPLMLQVVLGLEASEIAALFLMPPAAMAQRLVRAKQKIRDAAIPFQIPSPEDYPERLGFVLVAIYALFCVGYNAIVVPNAPREDRDSPSFDALWLGQLVVALSDRDPEALGLLSLMLFVESRRDARRDAQGRYIPLSEQTPSLWDFEAIRRANALLKEAADKVAPGRFQIEAAIQSVHAARAQSGGTDWASILVFYDALLALTPTPVVLINRALAISHVQGIDAALEDMRGLDDDPRIAGYQPYWAARAHLLAKSGRNDEAERAYARAIALESDPAVREFLQAERSRLAN